MQDKNLKIRCWIELDQARFFGPGRARLLELVEEMGSLAQAAKAMEMSYKKAWDMVQNLNSRGSSSFVHLQKGGKSGGHAELTPHGKALLQEFRELDSKLQDIAKSHRDLLNLI